MHSKKIYAMVSATLYFRILLRRSCKLKNNRSIMPKSMYENVAMVSRVNEEKETDLPPFDIAKSNLKTR